MAFHQAEINPSIVGDSGPPLAGNHLADTSFSDFNTARTAMSSRAIPAEFGNVTIDFSSGGDQPRSEVKMAASDPEYIVDGPKVRVTVPSHGGEGADCGSGTITPDGKGGQTAEVQPGPKGCDVGPYTFTGKKGGGVSVKDNPRYVDPDEDSGK